MECPECGGEVLVCLVVMWQHTVMTNKCLLRPETSQSRAGRGHTPQSRGCLRWLRWWPVLAGRSHRRKSAGSVSVSVDWDPGAGRLRDSVSEMMRDNTNSPDLTDSDRMFPEIFPDKTRGTVRVTDHHPDDTEAWWRRGRRLSRSAEHLKIPQIPVRYLTWQWGGRWEAVTEDKLITTNYHHQLCCSDFYLS